MPSDRDRLVDIIAARLPRSVNCESGVVEYLDEAEVKGLARRALDALFAEAQDAPLVIQSDGSVGRLEQYGFVVFADDDDHWVNLDHREALPGWVPVYHIQEEAPDA